MDSYFDNNIVRLYLGDVRNVLQSLQPESIDCVITSPPYWGLRDYDIPGQIGLEPTVDVWCATMVNVFHEVSRVLKSTGTVWMNLGDSYSNKQLVGMPWRVAFALQADGWYLRSDIIWSKPNPMPEGVQDRPIKAHEYIFLLTKSPKYYYDADAIREPHSMTSWTAESDSKGFNSSNVREHARFSQKLYHPSGRNKRTVWEINTQPYPEAHFATYPEKLVEPCIMAGTSEKGVCAECGKSWERIIERVNTGIKQAMPTGMATHEGSHGTIHKDGREKTPTTNPVMANKTIGWQPTCGCNADTIPATVLDPFVGSGTTLAVAQRLGRKGIGIDLSLEYLKLAQERIVRIPLPLL